MDHWFSFDFPMNRCGSPWTTSFKLRRSQGGPGDQQHHGKTAPWHGLGEGVLTAPVNGNLMGLHGKFQGRRPSSFGAYRIIENMMVIFGDLRMDSRDFNKGCCGYHWNHMLIERIRKQWRKVVGINRSPTKACTRIYPKNTVSHIFFFNSTGEMIYSRTDEALHEGAA